MDNVVSLKKLGDPVDYTGADNDQSHRTFSLARIADFRLGNATVRPSVRIVDGPNASISVEPRVMQVLLALAEAGGAVLTRDDLMQICWKGQTVGDDSVNRAIAEGRRVARETQAGFTIETISRVGYRLNIEAIEPVQPLEGGNSDEVAKSNLKSSNRRTLLVGGVAAVMTVGGFTIWNLRSVVDPEATRLIEESKVVIRAGTPATDRQAISLLERAVTISPRNAESLGLLALAIARAEEHAGPDKSGLSTTRIDQVANEALSLNPDNADAKAALAIAIPYYGDWFGAEDRFNAVLAKNPDHLVMRASLSFFLGAVGRMRESAQLRLAKQGDALFDANLQFGHIYALWFLGRIGEADRMASRAMQMWPRHPATWFARLWLLAGTARFDRALAHVDERSIRPSLPRSMIETLKTAIAAAASKDVDDVSKAENLIMTRVGSNVSGVVNAMMLLNLIGANDQAFGLADAYYLEKGGLIVPTLPKPGEPVVKDQRRRKTNMLFTPIAASMQRDPRFAKLMEDIGLADYWRQRGVRPDYQNSPI